MEEKVSIIVPVYNVENYLRRCLDALINQTYDNLEIILVDDGAKDSSGQICDEYAERDSRIKVIHQENGGQSKARNHAMEIASGAYYCFVDSDDYVPVDYIEKLMLHLQQSHGDLSICEYEKFTGDKVKSSKEELLGEGKEYSLDATELIRNMHTVRDELYVVMWGKLFKKELLDGISFPEGRICEDLAVLYRIYDKVTKAVYWDEKMYYYFRNNTNSSTFRINKKFYQDVFLALDEELEYLEEKHPELAGYPKKTYLYWIFDYYRQLHANGEKQEAKEILKKYRALYKVSQNVEKDKFYTFFYWMPNLYLFLKNRK